VGPLACDEESSVGFFLDSFAAQSARNQVRGWTSVTWLMPDERDDSGNETIAKLFQLLPTTSFIVAPEPLREGWNKFEAALDRKVASAEKSPIANYPRPDLRVAYVPPGTETEKILAQLWSDLLGVKDVGIHDNFLELGGDSLMATRLISRMKDRFQQDLPVRLIFEASTIAELAKAVAASQTAAVEQDDVDDLISMLEQLSEEEVEQELARRKQPLAKGA
jgi:acyl carrier protein